MERNFRKGMLWTSPFPFFPGLYAIGGGQRPFGVNRPRILMGGEVDLGLVSYLREEKKEHPCHKWKIGSRERTVKRTGKEGKGKDPEQFKAK